MPTPLDTAALRRELRLLLQARGVSSASDLRERLGISQPSFSRLVSSDLDFVRVGAGRASRWGLRREISGLPLEIPVHRIDPQGRPRRVAVLTPLHDDELRVEDAGGGSSVVVQDLPWFLEDLRPAGYLGRLVPRRFPELGAPSDILRWGPDHVLRYLVFHGVDAPGDLVVGDRALERIYADPGDRVVPVDARAEVYPTVASDVLRHGGPGSSAGGEQPKFTAIRDDGDRAVAVLVKFSPPVQGPGSQRVADLLLAEHHALSTLAEAGISAATTAIVRGGDRVFLEVERFDRTDRGRRGVVSLRTLDAEFAGVGDTWPEKVQALARLGVVPAQVVPEARLLHAFGRLIGNTDMHAGNLSFFLADALLGERRVAIGLTPAYDMLPMAFAPVGGNLPDPVLAMPAPLPELEPAFRLASETWARIAHDDRVSPGFREIARGMRRRVESSG
jgi:hypothetical protein